MDGRSLNAVNAAGLEFLSGSKDLHIGREGAFVVIGPDPKEVAAALTAGAKKAGLLGDDKTAAAVKDVPDPLAVGVFSLGKGIVEVFKETERQGAAPALTAVGGPAPPAPPPSAPGDKPPEAPKMSKRAEKTVADAAKAVESLPPTVVGIGRTPEGLTLDLRQSGLKSVSVKLIDLWVNATLERMLERQNPPRP